MTLDHAKLLFDAMDKPRRERVRTVFNDTFWDPARPSVYDAFMAAVAAEADEQLRLAEETTDGVA